MLLLSRFGMSRAGTAIVSVPNSGPGPSAIAYGDSTMGFFGEVASSDFISGSALASAIGLTAGTLINDTTAWLKFSLNGEVLFVPKSDIRQAATWQDIYQAGAVYGDNTVGTYPSGSNRLQNASVTIQEKQFKVKMLSGSTGDRVSNNTGNDIPTSRGTEWNKLFYPLSNTDVASAPTPRWKLYNDAQLDLNNRYKWCKETPVSVTSRIIRGGGSISNTDLGIATEVGNYFGWRPCLVLQ